MRNFSSRFGAFIAANPNLSVFLVGFSAFCGSVAAWSVPVACATGGAILMTLAAFPYVARRKD